jgi:hypothetical protein
MRRQRFGGEVGTGMTIKLVMMAAMYCVIVLAPQFFPTAKREQADRA